MQSALAAELPRNDNWFARSASKVRTESPSLVEWAAATSTTLLLVLSFPNFDLSLLAGVALIT
jgi:hypothetical protein